MKIEEIRDILQCKVLTGDEGLSTEVHDVVASDGMSEILAFHCPGALMLTGLTNIQSVRTADFADVRAIVYLRGKEPNERVIQFACKKKIPLLTTTLGMFDACGILRDHGMKGAM